MNPRTPLRVATLSVLLALAVPVTAFAQAPAAPAASQEVTVPAEVLAQYVGTYTMGPNASLYVRLDGTQLSAQLTGQGAFDVYPESETRFNLRVVPASIEFQKDANGAVTGVTLMQNGQAMTAPRASGDVPELVVRKEIAVPEAILARYVGNYPLAPTFVMAVTLENGQLMTQATGQPKIPIFAESETTFFPKVVEATIEFQVDAAGTVTGLVLNQGGQSMPAPKQ